MSFVDALFQRLASEPDRVVLAELASHGDLPYTAAALLRAVARARGGLRAAGVQPGDRVVFIGANSLRWVAFDLAVLAEGAIGVPLYARQAAAELAAMSADCTPRLRAVATRDLRTSLQGDFGDAELIDFDTLFAAEPIDAPPAPREPDDTVTLVYTSGTSGGAKGVRLTERNVAFMLPVTGGALGELMHQPAKDDRVFHYLPFCFAGSRLVLWTCLHRGTAIWLSTDLDRILDEIAVAKPHYLLNVPLLLERIRRGADTALRGRGRVIAALYDAALAAHQRRVDGVSRRRDTILTALADRLIFSKLRARFGPNLRFLICGSAPLPPETAAWFAAVGIPVYQVYGLTETTGILSMDRAGSNRPGTVGYAIPGVELRLGAQDELLARGANLFPGYWERADASEAAFEDGWFRTGDQAALDPDGRLRIIGRTKNLLVPTTGHNIAPEPIEESILESVPALTHVVLIGHARPHLVALTFGPADDAAIRAGLDAVNQSLPHYRRIRAHHHRAEPLTDVEGLLTANGKLRRAVIEARFQAAIGEMYR